MFEEAQFLEKQRADQKYDAEQRQQALGNGVPGAAPHDEQYPEAEALSAIAVMPLL